MTYNTRSKLTQEEVVRRLTNVHGDIYDYSNLEYVNSRTKLKIVCKKHGDFEQLYKVHVSGSGCPKCANENKTRTTKQFVNKSKSIHGDTYDYSLVKYKGSFKEIKIICKEHGIFEQSPHVHLSGSICKKCSDNKKGKQKKSNTKQFISKANKVHNSIYDYSETKYKNSHEKVTISCIKHGKFEQTPANHKQGKGCPKCHREMIDKLNKENPRGWSYTNWKKFGINSKNFDSFKVYIIKCWNDEEEFYKIGKTFTTLKKRYDSEKSMPYNYEIIKIFKGEAEKMSTLEKQLQKNNKHFKYVPNTWFGGVNECFKKVKYDL